jgi:hypothetical protein
MLRAYLIAPKTRVSSRRPAQSILPTLFRLGIVRRRTRTIDDALSGAAATLTSAGASGHDLGGFIRLSHDVLPSRWRQQSNQCVVRHQGERKA